jgi:coenzyme F420-0:L-glutamate ligase/coenzyme F420-1:gamma-L-glutamate ligase
MRLFVLSLPLVKPGDDLGELIVEAAKRQGVGIEEGDVVAVAQSVVSKAEGAVVELGQVQPSPEAMGLASKLGKDPREVEIILRESAKILRAERVLICRTQHGFVCANAGVDHSNAGEGRVTVLPRDPDTSAARIRRRILELTGKEVAVIITDSWGRTFRRGSVGHAIGISGLRPLLDLRGKRDLYGRELKSKVVCVADALAAAAVLMMGEAAEGTPVVIIRNAPYQKGEGGIKEVVRPEEEDLFL